MRIEDLKVKIGLAMPALDKNLAVVNGKYMAGEIASGVFRYALSRHNTACNCLLHVPKNDKTVADKAVFISLFCHTIRGKKNLIC